MFKINFYNFKFQRVIARALLPLFFIWACVVPRQAHAFVPAAIGLTGYGGAAGVASGTGGLGLLGAGAGLGALGVGAALGYLTVDYLSGGDAWQLRFPLTTASPVPPPAASPNKPLTGEPHWFLGTSDLTLAGTTPQADCNGYIPIRCPDPTTYNCVGASASVVSTDATHAECRFVSTNWPDYHSSQIVYYDIQYVNSCGAGYNLVNGVCVLSDPRAATPDKKCDYERAGSALAMISDPECAASGTAIPAICSAADMICSGVGTSDGKPFNYIIAPSPDGGTIITTNLQSNVGGQTQITTTTTTVGSGGTVTQVSGNVAPGTLPPSTTGAATSPSTNPSPLVNPTMTIPTDYARTGEAAAAAAPLANKLDTLHNDLTPGTTPTADPITPMNDRITAMQSEPGKPSINWIPSLMPGNAAACVPVPINGDIHSGLLNGFTGSTTFDICDKLDIIRQVFGYLIFVYTVVFVYRRFTRSNATGEG